MERLSGALRIIPCSYTASAAKQLLFVRIRLIMGTGASIVCFLGKRVCVCESRGRKGEESLEKKIKNQNQKTNTTAQI